MKQQFPKLRRTTIFVFKSSKTACKFDTDLTTATAATTITGEFKGLKN